MSELTSEEKTEAEAWNGWEGEISMVQEYDK